MAENLVGASGNGQIAETQLTRVRRELEVLQGAMSGPARDVALQERARLLAGMEARCLREELEGMVARGAKNEGCADAYDPRAPLELGVLGQEWAAGRVDNDLRPVDVGRVLDSQARLTGFAEPEPAGEVALQVMFLRGQALGLGQAVQALAERLGPVLGDAREPSETRAAPAAVGCKLGNELATVAEMLRETRDLVEKVLARVQL